MKSSSASVVFVVCVLVLLVSGVAGNHDYFSATVKLTNLLDTERQVIAIFQNFIAAAEEKLDTLKRYVEHQQFIQNQITDIGRYVSNPLNAYQMLKRMTVGLEDMESISLSLHDIDPRFALTCLKHHSPIPKEDDLHGAAQALIRLQDTYKLNMSAMTRGSLVSSGPSIPPVHSAAELTGRDCIFFGKHAYNLGLLDTAVEWFQTGLNMVEVEGDNTITREEVEPLLTNAITVHDDIVMKGAYQGRNWKTASIPFQQRQVGRHSLRKFEPNLMNASVDTLMELEQFSRLCRGERLRPPSWDKHLRCRYFRGHHPYLWLQPIKLEEHSTDPYIVLLHDIIDDKDIQEFQNFAVPQLRRSSHLGQEGTIKTTMARTSSNTWLGDEDHPLALKINRKLEMITNLAPKSTTSDAESYQVANYGIGGHYVPHTDFLYHTDERTHLNDPFFRNAGDRLATLMFYLSDVEAGGATVFPYAGVALWPKKGSAAFWWNLKPSGEGDPLTRHGACPVLHGSKWISNKWFRAHGQMFRKKCTEQEKNGFCSL